MVEMSSNEVENRGRDQLVPIAIKLKQHRLIEPIHSLHTNLDAPVLMEGLDWAAAGCKGFERRRLSLSSLLLLDLKASSL